MGTGTWYLVPRLFALKVTGGFRAFVVTFTESVTFNFHGQTDRLSRAVQYVQHISYSTVVLYVQYCNDGADDDDDDDGVSDPTEIEESVNAGGIAGFLEAEAQIDAIKSFVRREGYPQAVLDRLSSAVHDMRTHRSKKRRKDATLHRFGF